MNQVPRGSKLLCCSDIVNKEFFKICKSVFYSDIFYLTLIDNTSLGKVEKIGQ